MVFLARVRHDEALAAVRALVRPLLVRGVTQQHVTLEVGGVLCCVVAVSAAQVATHVTRLVVQHCNSRKYMKQISHQQTHNGVQFYTAVKVWNI